MIVNLDISASLYSFYNEYNEMYECDPTVEDCLDFVNDRFNVFPSEDLIESIEKHLNYWKESRVQL